MALVFMVVLFVSALLSIFMHLLLLGGHEAVERTFTHGIMHGALATIFTILPAIMVISLFEKRSAAYMGIHIFYWIIVAAIMGGIIMVLN